MSSVVVSDRQLKTPAGETPSQGRRRGNSPRNLSGAKDRRDEAAPKGDVA
ncbi:hypothetical protein JCM9957A_03910 [Kineosporia succinea]